EGEYDEVYDSMEDVVGCYEGYVCYKATKSLLDYDDLLTKLKDLLSNQEEIRRRLSHTYQFIMVDEYQDTNALQAQIIRLLAATHNNVADLGTYRQSIQ